MVVGDLDLTFHLNKMFIYKHIFFWCSNPGGGSSRGRRQKHGEDVVHTLKVSLEDLYNGTTKKLSLSRNILCQKCKGYFLYLSLLYSSLIVLRGCSVYGCMVPFTTLLQNYCWSYLVLPPLSSFLKLYLKLIVAGCCYIKMYL